MEAEFRTTLSSLHESCDLEVMKRTILTRMMDLEDEGCIDERGPGHVVFRRVYATNPMIERIFGLQQISAPQRTDFSQDGIRTHGTSRMAVLGCSIGFSIEINYAQTADGVKVVANVLIDMNDLAPSMIAIARPVLDTFMRRRFDEERAAEAEVMEGSRP